MAAARASATDLKPWSLEIGAPGQLSFYSMKLDASGAIWVAGTAASRAAPADAPVFEYGATGAQDYFVARVSPQGRLMWLAFVGGSGEELPGPGLQVDGDCFATTAGSTQSPDFPVTPGAYRSHHAGGIDAVVFRLGPDGRRLEYATYLGGSGNENSPNTALGPDGSVTLAGSTGSSDFPVTVAAKPGHANTQTDVYACRLNRQGHMVYSCILSGDTDDGDRADGLAVAPDGSAYIVGHTWSTDFPAVRFGGRLGGFCDGFIVKLDGAGRLVGGRFLGGESCDMACRVAVDAVGSPVVVGGTLSLDLPVTPGAFQPRFGGGGNRKIDAMHLGDVFVCRFTPDLARTEYFTYLGGPGTEDGAALSDLYVTPEGRSIIVLLLPPLPLVDRSAPVAPPDPFDGLRTLIAVFDRDGRAEGAMLRPTMFGVRLVLGHASEAGAVSLLQLPGATVRGRPLRSSSRKAMPSVALEVRDLADPSGSQPPPAMGAITPVNRQFALVVTSAPPPGAAPPGAGSRLRLALCRVAGAPDESDAAVSEVARD
ncbi:MAG: hypothetical protein NT029_14345 [Armatimonadetes bacterium]|nr:hypothetical protein [Armatimonadota bacterium]